VAIRQERGLIVIANRVRDLHRLAKLHLAVLAFYVDDENVA